MSRFLRTLCWLSVYAVAISLGSNFLDARLAVRLLIWTHPVLVLALLAVLFHKKKDPCYEKNPPYIHVPRTDLRIAK